MHTARATAVLILTFTALTAFSGCASPSPSLEPSPETFLERVRADTDADKATDEELLSIGEEMCSIAEGLSGDELEDALDQVVASVDDPEMAANVAVVSVHALAHLCPEQGQKLEN